MSNFCDCAVTMWRKMASVSCEWWMLSLTIHMSTKAMHRSLYTRLLQTSAISHSLKV